MEDKIVVGKSILETITVALYENPIILFREYVQNSLDAYNRALDDGEDVIKDFHVEISVDTKEKRIVIRDNGYGIATEKLFRNKMKNIGSSDKVADRTRYIGFRGIGRISGLPFCTRLTFRNKAKDASEVNICIWEGEKYRKELDAGDPKDNLESIIDKIVVMKEEQVNGKKEDGHYFEVILEGYDNEIKGMMEDKKFKEKLTRMLPLKYRKDFTGAKKIINKYNEFMKNESLERFMVAVNFDGEDLVKSYDDDFILGSDIVFWEIRGKQKKDGAQGDKIGLLWFTFDKHLKSNNNDEYYGLLTRSKNVLMGTNDKFAQVADDNKSYITTFREMAQALRGVYGELLINSPFLRDNSRRDWFLPDQHSSELENIITEFMRRLHNYRYCASRYFRANPSKQKDDLKEALDELIDIKTNQIDYDYFYKRERAETSGVDSNSFSEQDIPRQSQNMKKCYDELMAVIEKFFHKIKRRNIFLQLRAFLAKHFSRE